MLPFTRKVLRRAGKQVFTDGMRVFEEERVVNVTYDARVVSGEITAMPRNIKSSIKVHDDLTADNQCPCRISREEGLICAHAVALCLELLKIYADPDPG